MKPQVAGGNDRWFTCMRHFAGQPQVHFVTGAHHRLHRFLPQVAELDRRLTCFGCRGRDHTCSFDRMLQGFQCPERR